MQVTITTPTSSATGHYLLPYDDASKATFTIEPEEVASISPDVFVACSYFTLSSWMAHLVSNHTPRLELKTSSLLLGMFPGLQRVTG